jgi:hypothetical protein
MDSQDPEDLELTLSQLAGEPTQLSQPLISRRHLRNEAEPSESHVQPRSDSNLQQLASLRLDARALVIVLEVEATLSGGHQVIFEGCFENTNEGQMVSRFSNENGHRLWLQGPLNHLSRERRTSFIAAVLRRILEFLNI